MSRGGHQDSHLEHGGCHHRAKYTPERKNHDPLLETKPVAQAAKKWYSSDDPCDSLFSEDIRGRVRVVCVVWLGKHGQPIAL